MRGTNVRLLFHGIVLVAIAASLWRSIVHSRFVFHHTARAFALLMLLAACRDKKSPGPTGPDPYPSGSSYDVLPATVADADFSFIAIGDLSSTGSPSISADGKTVAGTRNRRAVLRWTVATGLTDLGNLPGGDGYARAKGITPDGAVIVGGSRNAAGIEEAFRWTTSGGMVPLGLLHGVGFTRAEAIAADGNTVVGWGATNAGNEAFRWTPTHGVIGLGSLDVNDFASAAFAVSANGNVVTGIGSGAADFNGDAFVWFPGTGMINLKQYLLNHGITGIEG